MNLVTSWCQFDPLEEVWVGDCYPEEFYNIYKDPVRSIFCKINEKTKKDFEQLQQILESLGIKVCRPYFSNDVEDYCDEQGRLFKPPVAPRDNTIVLGETLYHVRNLFKNNPWQSHLNRYIKNNNKVIEAGFLEKFGYIMPPSIVRLGKDLLIDRSSHEHSWNLMEKDVIPEWGKIFDIQVFDSDGHADSVFCVIGKGKILTSHWKNDYNEFKNWEIQRIKQIFHSNKNLNYVSNSKNWWVDGINGNYPVFNKHVEQFAYDWVGCANETVFEVNSLLINESLIITTGVPDLETQQWFKKHKVDFIAANMSTRGFWDSGVHCATVDIRRCGSCQKIL